MQNVITFPLLLDDDEARGAPVDVIDIGAPGWRTLTGQVQASRGQHLEISFDDPEMPPPSVGSRVVLNLRKGHGERHSADVTRSWPGGFEACKRRTRLPERRVYPRLMGGIPLDYIILPGDQAGATQAPQAWVDGLVAGPAEGWASPDPLMNFSVTGLCFEAICPEDEPPCSAGDVFLGWMAVGSDAQRHRVAGLVVRATAIPRDEQKIPGDPAAPQPTHRVAINFTVMEDAAVEALTAYTLQLQLANL